MEIKPETVVEEPTGAGQGEVVDAQLESQSAQPPAGQSETVDGQADTAQEPTASAAKPQTRAENAAFARMRRELEQSRAEVERYKRLSSVIQKEAEIASQDPDDIRRAIQARNEGVDPAVIRMREEDAERQAQERLKADPAYKKSIDELNFYKGEYLKSLREKDVDALRKAYPDENITMESLPADYVNLRAAGVENLTAYEAVRAVKAKAEASKKPTPPDTGAVGTGKTEPEFFTPEEVDRLTDQELDDPKIMAKVMKSMSKWKK